MSPLVRLAARSLWNRRLTAGLTVFAIAVSVTLLLGVQKLRAEARDSFASTVSGVDLVVGARSGPLNLLLYSVFRVGDATANVSWQSYQLVARHRDVAWTIPISLGDSHRGYRVLGTSGAYFEHYRYGRKRPLAFAAGKPFVGAREAVLGAEVAAKLGYSVGSSITVAHGLGEVSFAKHDDHPFTVVGILEPTGTPVDRAVHVDLAAIDEIHVGWESGMKRPAPAPPAIGTRVGQRLAPPPPPPSEADTHAHDEHAHEEAPVPHEPVAITAFLVGMKDRAGLFQMQRALNEYKAEPLTAIIPGVALQQLWELVGVADRALMMVAACVVLAGLLGMLAAILTSLNERRREMAILRSVGARPAQVFALMLLESGLLALGGVVLGLAGTYGLLAAAAPFLGAHYGLYITLGLPTAQDAIILCGVVLAGLAAGLLPAWRAYRNSLADGLTIRT
ncbi:MAG: ABC transporter permease [Gammaproteobacteria bacterium]|nr:ABC transporter permease [Gammaproteobacteria bacterium]